MVYSGFSSMDRISQGCMHAGLTRQLFSCKQCCLILNSIKGVSLSFKLGIGHSKTTPN